LAAKEVLIKSVAQDIPTYVMGVFKVPDRSCEEITQLIRKFWWGGENEANVRCNGSHGKSS
jgi:hypothetical protein